MQRAACCGNDLSFEKVALQEEICGCKRTVKCYNNSVISHQSPFTLSGNQPLIGIPLEENGQEVVRYFSEETQADKAISKDATQTALNLACAWSDLSWEETD